MPMDNPTMLSIVPSWTDVKSPIPVYFSATVAGVLSQRVTVTSADGKTKYVNAVTSGITSSADFGKQFVNVLRPLPFSQNEVLSFSVKIEYYQNNSWNLSAIVAQNNMSLGDKGFVAVAAANDGGSDADYNDCVVTITAWNQSSDV